MSHGAELEFEIVCNDDKLIRARGTVVRVQEPSWLNAGGTAVRFDWIDSPARLDQMIRGNPGAAASTAA
jgi:hypothetical protein